MSSQTSQSSHGRSTNTIQGVPISIFNQQLMDEARKTSANKDTGSAANSRESRSNDSRHYRRSHHRKVSVTVTASATVSHQKSNEARERKVRRSMSTQQSTSTKRQSTYNRPVGSELVSMKQPSCTGLPPQWTSVHDRFIAYLATHAPLDRTGKVQRKEESQERWRNEDITRLVMERFGGLDGCIKVCMIENRLTLLDQAGDNDYFKMPYGAYRFEKWGWGV